MKQLKILPELLDQVNQGNKTVTRRLIEHQPYICGITREYKGAYFSKNGLVAALIDDAKIQSGDLFQFVTDEPNQRRSKVLECTGVAIVKLFEVDPDEALKSGILSKQKVLAAGGEPLVTETKEYFNYATRNFGIALPEYSYITLLSSIYGYEIVSQNPWAYKYTFKIATHE
jgi:hypothetical protein